MRTRWLSLVLAVVGLGLSVPAWAVDIDLKQTDGSKTTQGGEGTAAHSWTKSLGAGEDLTATGGGSATGVLVTEDRYITAGVKTADFQVKASAGFLHCIILAPADVAPTAGQIDVYDNTAESGTKIFHYEVVVTTMFAPIQICPDVVMSTGIYLGFTTTADVNVTVVYR
jgi:hypothetical protein